MPQVPRLDAPQVARTALPGVRRSADTHGAFAPPTPIDISGVSKMVEDIYHKERQKADQIAVIDADSQMAAFENDLMFHPEHGVLNRKGKDALSAPEDVKTAWDKQVSTVFGGLSTDEQRTAFQERMANRYQDLSTTVQRHVFQERQTYDQGVTESYVDNERNAAMANFTDPARIATSVQRQSDALKQFGARNGWSPDKVQAMTQDAVSKTHTGVINLMLAHEDDQTASAYYAQHKSEIIGTDSVSVERALDEGSTRGESQRAADDIVHKYTNRADAIDAVNNIKNPKIRDAAEERVNRFFTERRQAKQELQDDLYLRATNLIDARPGSQARDVVPPHLWAQLDLSQRSALENRSKGDNLRNDDRKWLTFLDMRPQDLGTMSQAEFETKYWSHFDKEHRERAAMQWAGARDAIKTGAFDPKHVSTITFNDRVSNTLRTSGLVSATKEPSKYSADEVRMAAAFETEAAKQVDELNATKPKGQSVSGEEIQGILDKLVVQQVYIDRVGLDTHKPLFAITQDERGKSYVPYDQVPAPDKQSLMNIMRSRGVKQTKSKVERAYAAVLLRDREMLDAILNEK